ncbi:MAG: PEP/pyruvate-binding domain-containing protein [Nanoarchaeota archaeon]|nr:PEP/pyruvate-binding domain-containing protein [Nanoarchaeota archaeon]
MENKLGKKAANLAVLSKKGFNIPKFSVLNREIISKTLRDIGISEEYVYELFFRLPENKALNGLKLVRKKIHSSNISFPYTNFLSKNIIIRSSASVEDSEDFSFAGMFESEKVINKKQEIINGIKKVIAASFSDRVYFYIKRQRINEIPKISIIIQEFIEGEVSGVLFTEFNENGKSGALINYNFGTAESVVQGKSPKSLFLPYGDRLHKQDDLIRDENLKEIISAGKKIQTIFGKPQDIEWTVKGSKLFILQSRPITSLASEETRVWDNSNIVESYSGVVLPLTASFARRAYKIAYINLVKLVGLSDKKIEQNMHVFENLLGFFYGRFYYNMINWYKIAALFPGYEKNKENLNSMLTAKTKADLDKQYKKNISTLFKIRYYSTIIILYPFFEYRINNFKSYIKKRFFEFRNMDLSKLTTKELIDLYNGLEQDVLTKWSITLENDFLLMTIYGKLREFAKANSVSEQEILAFISDIKNLASANQVFILKSISNQFFIHENLVRLAKKEKYDECLLEIKNNQIYSGLNKKLEFYFNNYGGRFANELRLESENLDENPSYIIRLLLLYKNSPKKEIVLEKKVLLPQNLYFKFLIRKTKHYARLREETRLLRSQAFGYVRTIFKELGKKLKLEGTILDEKDIFYLEIDEIKNYISGSSTTQNLKSLVSLRKKDYADYKKVEIPGMFTTQGSPYLSIPLRTFSKKMNNLSGLGCSPGIVRGKVKILKEFELPKKGKYDIVVTKNTDPGWTPLFGLINGLILEQGGLLSHAAIVSRELNLPCVISVEDATSRLKDGQIVTINGFTGEIKLHE